MDMLATKYAILTCSGLPGNSLKKPLENPLAICDLAWKN